MGEGIEFLCHNCFYYTGPFFCGIGMMHPTVYMETVKKMKKGKYGDECKKFFKEHKDGAVNCEIKVAQCTSCRTLHAVHVNDLYIPSTTGETYKRKYFLCDWDLERCNYRKYMTFKHTCPVCGGESVVKDEFICPRCGKKMQKESADIYWD